MLRNIFPVSKLISDEIKDVTISDLTKHDDLVSIICINKNSLQDCLLFQYAVSQNCEAFNVAYIVPEPFQTLPKHVEGMFKPDILMMEAFTFLYINTVDDLSDYLSELHTLAILPNIVIIQNLAFYVSQFDSDKFHSKTAKLFALIKETAKYMATKVENIDEAKFLVSVNASNSEDLIALVRKNFKNIWYVQDHTDQNEYSMTLFRNGSSINLHVIFIEGSQNIRAIRILKS